ncbi:uncharacterized protein LOC124797586 [Schistocerca piceifrons]|uniref:uncharacterized protein LOC124797586 n=1 Tax=Schistocerca piceifrons TaxID=274613 RepID=UPI001F5E4745|nr:uncharacterized protein LOC124797586 [Schistocerca piceifrons]
MVFFTLISKARKFNYYSFVTPVTSLVVVKPNDTSAVDLQRAGGSQRDYFPSGTLSTLSAGQIQAGVVSLPLTGYLQSLPLFLASSAFPMPLDPSQSACCPTAVGQAQTLRISEITWLGSVSNASHITLEVNGTALTYELAFNKTESQLEECATPDGGPGQCRHLANCVLPSFAHSLDDFLPYLCVVDSSYVGACCPNTTFPPMLVG